MKYTNNVIKRKTIAIFAALTLMAGLLTGCMGQSMTIGINADGSCSYTLKFLYEQSMYDSLTTAGDGSASALNSGDFEKKTESINSKTYYTFTRNFSFANFDAMKEFLTDDTSYYKGLTTGSKNPASYEKSAFQAPFSSVALDGSDFTGVLSQESMLASEADSTNDIGEIKKSDLKGYDSVNAYYKELGLIVEIAVTLPSAISESNGTVSGNTASWYIENLPDDGKLIAVTKGNPITGDITAPTITGVKNKGLYNKKVNIKGIDDVCLKKFTVNGISYGTDHISIGKSGKYTVIAADANNNQTTVKFTVDTKAPKIKGIKYGKISKKGITLRFSDNMGVRSVKINGKKAGLKKATIKKAGKYTVKVTDIAGNVSVLKFQIKKR